MSDTPRKTTTTRTGARKPSAQRTPGAAAKVSGDTEPRALDVVNSYAKSAPAMTNLQPPGEPASSGGKPRATELPLLQSVTDSAFRPSAVTRAALALSDGGKEATGPLWSTLPKVELTPVIAAVEAALGTQGSTARPTPAAELRTDTRAVERPSMTVLEGSSLAQQQALQQAKQREAAAERQSRANYQAAVDASTKLLEAVRAHAAAHSIASDDRITLGDMTLIAFADSKQQMAAASAYGAPDPKPVEKPLGQLPHPKVLATQRDHFHMLKQMAKDLRKEIDQAKKKGESRLGHNAQSD